jgi:hypothetical protein
MPIPPKCASLADRMDELVDYCCGRKSNVSHMCLSSVFHFQLRSKTEKNANTLGIECGSLAMAKFLKYDVNMVGNTEEVYESDELNNEFAKKACATNRTLSFALLDIERYAWVLKNIGKLLFYFENLQNY